MAVVIDGTNTPTAGGVGYGDGTELAFTSAGTSGQVLTSNGSGAPSFQAIPAQSSVGPSPFTATINTTALSGISSPALISATTLDSDRDLLLFTDASGYPNAIVYNSATNTFGSAVLIRSVDVASGTYIKLTKVSANSVLAVSVDGGALTALEAVALSISDTTITVGTAATKTLSVALGNWSDIFTVGSTFVLGIYFGTPSIKLLAMTVSGATVTIGNETSLQSTTSKGFFINAISSSQFLVSANDNSTTTTFTPVSISGTTLTLGTAATSTTSCVYLMYASALASGRIGVITSDSTRQIQQGFIVSVSGTTATATTVQLISTGSAVTLSNSLFVTSGSQILFYNGYTHCNVLTDSSGTAVAGTAVNLFTSAADRFVLGSSIYSLNSSLQPIKVSISGNNAVGALLSGAPQYVNNPSGYAVNTVRYPLNSYTNSVASDIATPVLTGVIYGATYAATYKSASVQAFGVAVSANSGVSYALPSYGPAAKVNSANTAGWVYALVSIGNYYLIRLTVA